MLLIAGAASWSTGGQREFLVRRDHGDAALRQVAREHFLQQGDAVRVECGRRLVEEPERPRLQREPRQPDTPTLAMREYARAQFAMRPERNRRQRAAQRIDVDARAVQRRERRQILLGGELVVKRERMTDEQRRGAQRRVERQHRCPAPGERTVRALRQAGDHAQQRRLAAAIRTGNDQRLAARQCRS